VMTRYFYAGRIARPAVTNEHAAISLSTGLSVLPLCASRCRGRARGERHAPTQGADDVGPPPPPPGPLDVVGHNGTISIPTTRHAKPARLDSPRRHDSSSNRRRAGGRPLY